ncbi:methyltransferase, FkbM family [Ectothiorhodospira mobilis]|uniref:Methyltransferase, FkbM family n=1 Tax=Ectothiorhodospira mobilis TaxID=195064 RepID=A0A1I4SIU4_ECTMO|nr:FkbM family methyltransferase [Ectothiorhodospira mobilis]SFM64334.1 methyltransferase, FkbM family [Ectothiorhodospira mobilis]
MSLRSQIARRLPAPLKQKIRAWVCGTTAAPQEPDQEHPHPRACLRQGAQEGQPLTLCVVPGDIISDSLLISGVWEPELTQALLEDAARGGLMVEVGANLGYFSLLWAAAHPDNRVQAFEPAPRNLQLFWQSIRDNQLQDRISVFPVAAGPRLEVADFDSGPDAQTGWGGVVNNAATATSPSRVIVAPLDTLLAQVPFVDVLKIDVEGFDTQVLEGCHTLLAERRIGKIYFEQNHPRMQALDIDPGQAQALLTRQGYRTERLTGGGTDVEEWVAEPIAG